MVTIPVDALVKAPILAVGRVEDVRPGPILPAEKGMREGTSRHCAADLKVFRATPDIHTSRISLEYRCYGPNAALVSGYPVYPSLEVGKTYVFPLRDLPGRWELIAEQGVGLVVPAIETAPRVPSPGAPHLPGAPPPSRRDFLLSEMVNLLARGGYEDVYQFGNYMAMRRASEVNDALLAGLTRALAPDSPRWLDISTAMLANLGIPRRSLDDLVSDAGPKPFAQDALALLAAAAIRHVPEAERRPGIIRNTLQYTAIHEWGSAATLVPEFKDDPLLLGLLPGYLERGQKGALYVASWLPRNGQTALVDVSLRAALKLVHDPAAEFNELRAACSLILRNGSDSQFAEYLEALQQAQTHDPQRCHDLWQVAWDENSPRTLRILAVMLNDRGRLPGSNSMRACDYSASLAEQYAGEKFTAGPWDQMTLRERDEAVQRARAWLAGRIGAAPRVHLQ